ncbi:hypothetical protein MTO96_013847 [Rhipicephalus appendiculatus]
MSYSVQRGQSWPRLLVSLLAPGWPPIRRSVHRADRNKRSTAPSDTVWPLRAPTRGECSPRPNPGQAESPLSAKDDAVSATSTRRMKAPDLHASGAAGSSRGSRQKAASLPHSSSTAAAAGNLDVQRVYTAVSGAPALREYRSADFSLISRNFVGPDGWPGAAFAFQLLLLRTHGSARGSALGTYENTGSAPVLRPALPKHVAPHTRTISARLVRHGNSPRCCNKKSEINIAS